MTHNHDLKTLVNQHCTSVAVFEEMLSLLLVGAHANGIDVSGAWEARESETPLEWDVVVTELERVSDAPDSTQADAGETSEKQ